MVRHGVGQHSLDAWHPLAQDAEDLLQPILVLFGQILDHVGQVVSGSAEPFLRTRFGLSARAVRRQVRYVPARNETTEGRDTRMVRELAESVYGQQIGRIEGYLHPFGLLIGFVPADRSAHAAAVLQKPKWLPPSATAPA